SFGSTVVASLFLHAVLFALLVIGARRAGEPEQVTRLNIRFAPSPISRPGPPAAKPAEVKKEIAKPADAPKPPKVEEKTPVKKEAYAPKQESLFGRSEKKVPTAEPRAASEPAAPSLAPPGTAVDEGFALPSVGAAGVTGLEGGDFPYTIYVNQMLAKIGRNWARPQAAGELLAQVYFVIDRDGRIRDTEIEKSSGSAAFDRAALRAIIESSPLAPLPFGYSGTWLGVHLTFH
ncbi:MAG TPA: TonB family protein, partial [Thermoanaerobaculia bacterium]|nr:TonB family protein [Thermoanaerobaculia bacterium]